MKKMNLLAVAVIRLTHRFLSRGQRERNVLLEIMSAV